MTTITITPCYEKIKLWCPYCRRHIRSGVRTVAVTYTQNRKFIGLLLGELRFTPCCKKGIQVPTLFDTPTEQEAVVEKIARFLEYSSFESFRRTNILKPAPRRILNSIRIERHLSGYTFDDLLDSEFRRKFESNPMDFRKFPNEGIGNVLH